MRALIDTHAFLWLATDETQLGPRALPIVKDPRNSLLFSTASAWEIAIKVGRGKLKIEATLEELIIDVPRRLFLETLPINAAHLVVVSGLPEHHRDPFDRLLVAQAQVEKVPLISIDKALDAYGVHRIW